MLTGRIQKTTDSKNRVNLPKKFLDRLTIDGRDEVYLLCLDGCVQIYNLETWSRLESKIDELDPFDPDSRMLQRIWGSHMEHQALDCEGRIILSEAVKQYAEIKKQVMIIGAINKIEVWGLEKFEKMLSGAPTPEDIAQRISKI
ncbi:MAG: hypothetical protein A2161_12875 [Candidatus Schekmanbacteria bacterium RBG_13_48_7]|uniref:Transcriptional regulator MraZ n=1 Tax=Candidatus Schekmanbacteria bacterium RBG_13_48_7 TaxID=1817878 RepID=A0A1F7RWG0_9BACT|nr:MAG: hypothetical protein A2161_12875 [Candidatus Schekmanbacteria bacterium RBG_13_48_7]